MTVKFQLVNFTVYFIKIKFDIVMINIKIHPKNLIIVINTLTKNELLVIKIFLDHNINEKLYPAKIEKISHNEITRAGVKVVCDKLVKSGILQSKSTPSPNHSRSTLHYNLPSDVKSFTLIISIFFKTLAKLDPRNWQKYASIFMVSKYIQQIVTSDLVREILSTKKIMIYKSIPLEKQLKKSVKNPKKFPNRISIAFPIRRSNMKISNIISEIQSKNEVKAVKIKKIIENYYEKTEHDETILPILYLIQISPSSLEYFLSNWKPWSVDGVLSFDHMGVHSIEHVLFRLIWNAVNDLSIIRHIPSYDDIHAAYISGGNSSTLSKSLLCIMGRGGRLIEYDAGFDTNWDFVGDGSGDVYDVITNPENCVVNIVSKIDHT